MLKVNKDFTKHFKSYVNKVFYIAEVGGNHEGAFNTAKLMCKLAIESGADAVKFQLYSGDTLVNPLNGAGRHKHFKKFELTKDQHIELAKMTIDAGKFYMASVWDEEMLGWIDPYIEIHKVGSGDLTHFKMLKLLVKTGKPIILSTGLSDLKEIKTAVDFIVGLDKTYLDNQKLCLLQCTSLYPTSNNEANLLSIECLNENFNFPVGYSDHTIGDKALGIAYVLGAKVIEKHFTDYREGKEFRDNKVSLTKSEVKSFLSSLYEVDNLLGIKEKIVTDNEIKTGHNISFRRGLYAKKNMKKGDYITEDSLLILRPFEGISASEYYNVLGKQINKDINKFAPIQINHIN